MAKSYDPRKKLRQIWNKCSNPLTLIISYEDNEGRYILTDDTKTFGRIIDPKGGVIYCSTYVLNIFKNTSKWYKYSGSQDILLDILGNVTKIWTNDKDSVDFDIEDYKKN
jgi:hypothetical protein